MEAALESGFLSAHVLGNFICLFAQVHGQRSITGVVGPLREGNSRGRRGGPDCIDAVTPVEELLVEVQGVDGHATVLPQDQVF